MSEVEQRLRRVELGRIVLVEVERKQEEQTRDVEFLLRQMDTHVHDEYGDTECDCDCQQYNLATMENDLGRHDEMIGTLTQANVDLRMELEDLRLIVARLTDIVVQHLEQTK